MREAIKWIVLCIHLLRMSLFHRGKCSMVRICIGHEDFCSVVHFEWSYIFLFILITYVQIFLSQILDICIKCWSHILNWQWPVHEGIWPVRHVEFLETLHAILLTWRLIIPIVLHGHSWAELQCYCNPLLTNERILCRTIKDQGEFSFLCESGALMSTVWMGAAKWHHERTVRGVGVWNSSSSSRGPSGFVLVESLGLIFWYLNTAGQN